jgi:hypothetical protein
MWIVDKNNRPSHMLTCMMSGGTSVTSPNDARVHHRPAPGFVKDDQATRAQDGRGVECSATERNGPSARGFVPPPAGEGGVEDGGGLGARVPFATGCARHARGLVGFRGWFWLSKYVAGTSRHPPRFRPKTEGPRPIPGGAHAMEHGNGLGAPRRSARRRSRCAAIFLRCPSCSGSGVQEV